LKNSSIIQIKISDIDLDNGVIKRGKYSFPISDELKKDLDQYIQIRQYLLAKLNVLNIEAKENLSENDAMAVYAGTSTCYYSYLYWKENYMKWKIALNKP
jgi:integrase